MQVTQHGHGSFCWAELKTTDAMAAKEFYGQLFGWTSVDIPMGEMGVYTMLQLNGCDAAAMYEDKSGDIPNCWGAYISVDNADAVAGKIAELGGTLVAGPFDVNEAGRMAVGKDPTGAVFQIFQPKRHIGYTIVDEPGSVCWNELNTPDVGKAGPFYEALLGYSIKRSEHPMPYSEFQSNGKTVAGMMQFTETMVDVPPHWLIYFAVEDANKTLELAKSMGANVLFGPMPIPTVGTIAVVADPQCAVFAIISQ